MIRRFLCRIGLHALDWKRSGARFYGRCRSCPATCIADKDKRIIGYQE